MSFDPSDDLINLTPRLDIPSIDEVLETLFEKHGMPRLGGASGKGWSSYNTYQRCPYLYKLNYVEGIRGAAALALETGSAFHTFMALHYTWMVDETLTLTPEVCREGLIEGGARVEAVLAGWKAYDSYADHYQNDYLYPLAVEQFAQGDNGNTCRYDLIARIDEPQPGIVPGAWIIEHKTAARFTADILDGWHNDGEVLGQIMVWKQAGLDKKYGKLRGNIVNIVGKQKVPQFHRTIVPAAAWHVEQHAADLRIWSAQIEMSKATDSWPKSRANCVSKFGPCTHFHSCSTNESLTSLRKIRDAKKAAIEAAKKVNTDETETNDETVPAAIDPAEALATDAISSENGVRDHDNENGDSHAVDNNR